MHFHRGASRNKCLRSKQKTMKTRSDASRSFMFHYAFLVAWEPTGGVHCNKLMHFVHKLLHPSREPKTDALC